MTDLEQVQAAMNSPRAVLYQLEAAKRRVLIEFRGWTQVRECIDGLGCWDHRRLGLRFIHSVAEELDDEVWAHVSPSRHDRVFPTWEQLRDMWRLISPDTAAVIVIPPEETHVNLGEIAHAWGCLTKPSVPDFTHGFGTI